VDLGDDSEPTDSRGREEINRLVGEFQVGGLLVAEFCRKHPSRRRRSCDWVAVLQSSV
jgi:hypothetical protein